MPQFCNSTSTATAPERAVEEPETDSDKSRLRNFTIPVVSTCALRSLEFYVVNQRWDFNFEVSSELHVNAASKEAYKPVFAVFLHYGECFDISLR